MLSSPSGWMQRWKRRAGAVLGAVLLSLVVLTGTPASATTWQITQLPFNNPLAINNLGQVAGVHKPGEGWNTSPSTNNYTSYLWTAGTRQTIGGSGFDTVTGINDAGQVVGWGGYGGTSWLYSGGVRQAWRDYEVGLFQDINNTGLILATGYYTNHASYVQTSSPAAPGGITDLGAFTASNRTFGWAINDSGQVVGWEDDPSGFITTFWTRPGLVDLSSVMGAPSWDLSNHGAQDVNNLGAVVGSDGNQGSIYQGGVFTPIPKPSGETGGMRVFAINDSSWVVGSLSAWPQPTNAFLYDGSTSVLLNSLIDPALGWDLWAATDINNAGQIIGYGSQGGLKVGFLLTPVPEPGSLVLLALGIAGLEAMGRRNRAGRLQ